jgi:TPR repeat protein
MFDDWGGEFSTRYRVFSYLEAAALCGHQNAQLKLAELNLQNTREGLKDSLGFGNVVDAYAWLNICAAWGHEASASRRDELEVEIRRSYVPATLTQCQVRSRQLLKIIESNKTSDSKVTILPAREN